MKEIFFIIPSYAGGGAERATITIASELQKKDNLSVALIVLNADGPLRDLPQSVEVVEFENKRSVYAFFDLHSFLKESNPDVVFSVLPQANILMYLVNKTVKAGWRTICMLQNFYERLVKKNNFFVSTLFRWSLESADYVIPNSKEMGKNLIENIDIGKGRVKTIYNPIDVKKIQKEAQEPVDHPVFAESNKVIIGVGSLTKQKGFRYLIESTKKVNDNSVSADLVLLGEGELENDLKAQAQELGIEDRVRFFGFVGNPYKYMRAADVFVLSSLWEGLPTVLIEAMVVGTCVVATNCPTGPREILKDGEIAPLISLKNAEAIANAVGKVLKDDFVKKHKLLERSGDFRKKRIVQEYKKLAETI